jgi:hypothetical protein
MNKVKSVYKVIKKETNQSKRVVAKSDANKRSMHERRQFVVSNATL